MTVADRVAERLARATFEERFGELGVAEAKTLFKCSKAEVYRRVKRGGLGCLKAEGAQRRGHGQAGRLTFLLEHLVRYQVERERVAGAPIEKIQKGKAQADQACASEEPSGKDLRT